MIQLGGRGAAPHGLWDLSSLSRNETQAMAVKAQNPKYQTTREPNDSILSTTVRGRWYYWYFSDEEIIVKRS